MDWGLFQTWHARVGLGLQLVAFGAAIVVQWLGPEWSVAIGLAISLIGFGFILGPSLFDGNKRLPLLVVVIGMVLVHPFFISYGATKDEAEHGEYVHLSLKEYTRLIQQNTNLPMPQPVDSIEPLRPLYAATQDPENYLVINPIRDEGKSFEIGKCPSDYCAVINVLNRDRVDGIDYLWFDINGIWDRERIGMLSTIRSVVPLKAGCFHKIGGRSYDLTIIPAKVGNQFELVVGAAPSSGVREIGVFPQDCAEELMAARGRF